MWHHRCAATLAYLPWILFLKLLILQLSCSSDQQCEWPWLVEWEHGYNTQLWSRTSTKADLEAGNPGAACGCAPVECYPSLRRQTPRSGGRRPLHPCCSTLRWFPGRGSWTSGSSRRRLSPPPLDGAGCQASHPAPEQQWTCYELKDFVKRRGEKKGCYC